MKGRNEWNPKSNLTCCSVGAGFGTVVTGEVSKLSRLSQECLFLVAAVATATLPKTAELCAALDQPTMKPMEPNLAAAISACSGETGRCVQNK